MTSEEMFARIEEIGIIPAVSFPSAEEARFAADAVVSGGIPILEITLTTPGAMDLIRALLASDPSILVGAGTVMDFDTARQCLDAGASFLTSTGFDLEMMQFALKHSIPIIPGALTPTEVLMAKRAGAGMVKIFPCSSLGGPTYIRALRRPFPSIRLVASGGVTQQTAARYINAGADVLGIGKELLPHEAVRTRNVDWIHELARRFSGMVRQARKGTPND